MQQSDARQRNVCSRSDLSSLVLPQILDRDAHKASHAVKLYMLELYQDELMDLLRVVDKKAASSPDVRTPRI